MKANVLAISWLLFNISILVLFPVVWLSGLLFYSDVLIEIANDSGGLLYLFPIFSLILLLIYSINDGRVYHFCSFRYLKTIILLNDNEYVYRQTFSLLEEVFEGKYYEKHHSHYSFHCKGNFYGQLLISFIHPKQKELWQLVMARNEFYMRTDEKKTRFGYRVNPKEHDQKLYQRYYNTLYPLLEQKEKDEKAQKEIARKKQEDMKKRQHEKAKQKEEEDHQEQLDILLKEIVEMKKHQVCQKELHFNQEKYVIQRNKRNILVKKDKEVFLKCTLLEEQPIIYYLHEKKYPKHLVRLQIFYEKYAGKRKSVH